MTPENLIIKDGFRTIRIDSYIEYLTKKPTCRITCTEEAQETINLDGEWECDNPEDASFYVNVEQIDQIISKLQEARSFLQQHLTVVYVPCISWHITHCYSQFFSFFS